MPITRIDSLGVTIKGNLFGGRSTRASSAASCASTTTSTSSARWTTRTPVRQRVFYLGLQGGFSMAGMAGFTIRVGLSELGPLSAFISVEIPGGILLEPTTGLTINNFAAGVEFFKTLPSIDDPFALRSNEFGLPTTQTADQWLRPFQRQVALQAKTIAANPSQSGFLAAFTSPMTITGSATIYSIYTSQAVFNGQRAHQDLDRRQVPDHRQAELRQQQRLDQRPPVRRPVEDQLERLGDGALPRRRARPDPPADDLRQAQDGLQERRAART